MAHKEMLPDGEVRSWLEAPMFWNVSSSVGYGCPNKKGDVLLVQYLLNSLARIQNQPKRLLVPDGKFGGKTWARIKQVQIEDLAVPDGMISAIDGSRLYSPNKKGLYTIILLNRYIWVQLRHYYMDIRRDPKCPADLIQILSGPMPQLV